ncbi:MAG: type II toxin-antitoxin system MqsA family antitoxin [Lachnospiraceae bacterium]|jgi:YgiT-type zinc finger domain-containing protein|nr:type II toxin-antitoxin system MqsA family antitoxin [Lachnospiraceae bacterium]
MGTCKYGEMKEAVTTYFTHFNNCYVIIENVPCLKCGQCGEEFINTSVAEKIDDILDSIEKIASRIFILDYAKAA